MKSIWPRDSKCRNNSLLANISPYSNIAKPKPTIEQDNTTPKSFINVIKKLLNVYLKKFKLTQTFLYASKDTGLGIICGGILSTFSLVLIKVYLLYYE
ncbi:MAG TPA: hypothetical protein GXX37_09905 [Clostridiaceae bacterium]|nr:hypothetical protein [Clostridiaceae bacterium]